MRAMTRYGMAGPRCRIGLPLLLGMSVLLASCTRSRIAGEGASGAGGEREDGGVVEPDATIDARQEQGDAAADPYDGAVTVDAAAEAVDCDDDFMSVWKAKQAERIEGDDVPVEGVPCFDCVEAADCPAVNCAPALACLQRHCLCTAERPAGGRACRAEDYPADVCECADDCFADGDLECRRAWNEYTACVVAVCRDVCS